MGSTKMPEAGDTEVAMVGNQSQDTIFDRLSEASKTWSIFYYDFPSSLLLLNMRKPDRAKNYRKIGDFFQAATGPEKDFPEFSLIEPKYYGLDQNDDHPPHNVMKAEKLIADVYNAIRTNDELWQSTLLVIFYDEHGGFYDHVVPESAVPPDDHKEQYDFTQYGLRVPALLVSPWVPPGVEKTTLDHTSVLKYVIDKWGLKRLTARVDAAKSVIQQPWLDRPRPERETPKFLRVANSDLIPSHPEWELGDISVHHDALDALVLRLEDKAEANFGEQLELSGLRFQKWFGSWLAGWGYRMARKLGDKRSEKMRSALEKILPGIDQWK